MFVENLNLNVATCVENLNLNILYVLVKSYTHKILVKKS